MPLYLIQLESTYFRQKYAAMYAQVVSQITPELRKDIIKTEVVILLACPLCHASKPEEPSGTWFVLQLYVVAF